MYRLVPGEVEPTMIWSKHMYMKIFHISLVAKEECIRNFRVWKRDVCWVLDQVDKIEEKTFLYRNSRTLQKEVNLINKNLLFYQMRRDQVFV